MGTFNAGISASMFRDAKTAAKYEGTKELALGLCDKSIGFDLSNIRPYKLKASLLREQGKVDEAKAMWKELIASELFDNTGMSGCHNNLGHILMAESKYEEALKEFELALSLNNQAIAVRMNIVTAHIGLGQYKDAANVCSEISAMCKGKFESDNIQKTFAALQETVASHSDIGLVPTSCAMESQQYKGDLTSLIGATETEC